MLIFTPMAAFAVTRVTGTGWSPLLYVLGGAVLGVSIGFICRWLRRPWVGQLAAMACIALAAAVIGYHTARPDPADIFARIFRTAPPAGVTNLSGRVQWFDGQTLLLRFDAEPEALAAAISAGGFQPDETFRQVEAIDQAKYVDRAFYMSMLADGDWRKSIHFRSATLYELPESRLSGRMSESAAVLVNESGGTWVMYNWGS